MRYNQFSYIPTKPNEAFEELKGLGFPLNKKNSDKANLEAFLGHSFLNQTDTDYALSLLIVDAKTDALTFFNQIVTNTRKFTMDLFTVIRLCPFCRLFKDPKAFLKILTSQSHMTIFFKVYITYSPVIENLAIH